MKLYPSVLKIPLTDDHYVLFSGRSDANFGTWIASGVAVFFLIIIILSGMYILRLRRKLGNLSRENVTYVNTAVSNPPDVTTSTGHKYDEVILHEITSRGPSYVNTTPGHLYNDVVLPTEPAVDDTPYEYARSEDVVRNKVREGPTYHNHELKPLN